MNVHRIDKLTLTISAAELVVMLKNATNRIEVWGLPTDGRGVDLKTVPAGLEVTYYETGQPRVVAPVSLPGGTEPPVGGTPAAMVV